MRFNSVVFLLQMADAFDSLEFYATNLDKSTNMNSGPRLHCRESPFDTLSSDQMRQLVRELNEAIRPVTHAWSERMLAKAREQLGVRSGLGVADAIDGHFSVDPEKYM